MFKVNAVCLKPQEIVGFRCDDDPRVYPTFYAILRSGGLVNLGTLRNNTELFHAKPGLEYLWSKLDEEKETD